MRFPRMQHRSIPTLATAALALLSIAALPGCVPLVVGGVATGGVVAAQERSPGGAVDDTVIRSKINQVWLDNDSEMYSKLYLSVQEGRVLVTGKVAKPEHRLTAVRLAWQVDGVREVANEIQVGESGGFGGYMSDSWILTRLRTELTFTTDIASINYSLECVDGVVYVMGIAQDQAELNAVLATARGIDGVKRVVSYVRVKNARPVTTSNANVTARPDTAVAPTVPTTNRGVERAPLPPPSASSPPASR